MSGSTPTTVHKPGIVRPARLQVRTLPGSLKFERLLADLEKKFPLQAGKATVRVRKWFDTDDWRLYRKKLLVFHERGRWSLIRRDSGITVASLSGSGSARYRFAGDFPASNLRDLLEPVLGVRALLPLVTLESKISCIRIRNKDSKTVALVDFNEHTARESGAAFRTVALKGMRGYDDCLDAVTVFFADAGIGREVSPHFALAKGVQSLGRSPGDYSSKFRVALRPDMTIRQAMVKIYRHLLATMRHNEPGLVRDLDTEFLHDFRVAVRRTRSGLGQVKGVLSTEAEAQARNGFSWLGAMTGPTRDLDVYLLDREKYLARLPENLRPLLAPFFRELERHRAGTQRELARTLQEERYRTLIQWWEAYLREAEQSDQAGGAGRSVAEVARGTLFRRYTRVMKKGRAVRDHSSDEDLHRLRIQCKKLRYGLEFFTSLFPAGAMKQAVKELKRLQDNLGTFNDLSVQQEMLRNHLAGLRPGSRKNQELATAIGGLLTQMHNEQQQVRREFSGRFDTFAGEENRQLYRSLFA